MGSRTCSYCKKLFDAKDIRNNLCEKCLAAELVKHWLKIDKIKGIYTMSVGRITMIEWTSDEAMQASFKLYLSTQKEYFPNAQAVINVKTGQLSMMSLAIYESFEEAEKNLVGRQKFNDAVAIFVKDTFYYEGDLHYFFKDPNADIVSEYTEKDRLFFEAERRAEKSG